MIKVVSDTPEGANSVTSYMKGIDHNKVPNTNKSMTSHGQNKLIAVLHKLLRREFTYIAVNIFKYMSFSMGTHIDILT